MLGMSLGAESTAGNCRKRKETIIIMTTKGSVLLIALALAWSTIGLASAADIVNLHVPPGGSSPNVLPFMIGVDEGFYRDEGLEVRRVGAAMTAGIQGLIAQSFDFSMILGTTTSAIMRGAPLKIIMIFDPRPLWWLYGSKKIKSLQDLKGGKLVGVSGFGTGHDVMSRAALSNHGIDPQRDVAFRVIANGAPQIAALLTVAIDATVVTVGERIVARKEGLPELLFLGSELEALNGGVVVAEKTLSQKPDYVRRFVRGTLKSLQWLRSNKEGSVDKIAGFYKVSKDDASDIHQRVLEVFTSDGTVPLDLQKRLLTFHKSVIKAEQETPPEKVFDFSIVQSLSKAR